MLKYIAIAIVLLTGCSHYQHFTPWCRHKAIYAAIVAGEKYPVRILRGKSTVTGYHVQAQYWDGKWRWLEVDNFGNIKETDQDGFYPEEIYDINEYFWTRFGSLINIANHEAAMEGVR